MHTDNYLNISITSYSDSSSISEKSVSIIICSSEAQLKQFEPRPQLLEKVKAAMEDEKGTILCFFAEKQYLILANTSNKTENWRVTGASLYKNLKKQKIDVAHISGLSNLETALKMALLEGLLLSSYQFNKYKKEHP